MNIVKKFNKFFGISALLAFLVMAFDLTYIVRYEPNNLLYYVSGNIFLLFAALFLLTAAILALRSFFWHIRHKKFGLFIRHYLYTVAFVFAGFLLLDYISVSPMDWLGCLVYSLCIAVIQIYVSGYKLKPAQSAAA